MAKENTKTVKLYCNRIDSGGVGYIYWIENSGPQFNYGILFKSLTVGSPAYFVRENIDVVSNYNSLDDVLNPNKDYYVIVEDGLKGYDKIELYMADKKEQPLYTIENCIMTESYHGGIRWGMEHGHEETLKACIDIITNKKSNK